MAKIALRVTAANNNVITGDLHVTLTVLQVTTADSHVAPDDLYVTIADLRQFSLPNPPNVYCTLTLVQ